MNPAIEESTTMAVASSGSFVGAVLETLGFYYQELILESFIGPFAGSIGAFFYVIGAFIAIFEVVQRGRFAMAGWMLVGPTLFFFVINTSTTTWGSTWAFGDEARNNSAVSSEVQSLLREKNLENGRPARVSWLFSKFTKITSKTVNEVVRVLSEGREGTDLLHQRRMEAFAAIHTGSIDDPGLLDLLHHSYMYECRDVIKTGRLIKDPQLVGSLDENVSHYHKALDRMIPVSSSLAKYLASVKAFDDVLYDKIMTSPSITEADPNQPRTAATAVNTKFNQLAEDSLRGNGPTINLEQFGSDYEKALSEISGSSISCNQVWDFARFGILVESKKIIDSVIDKTKESLDASSLQSGVDHQKLIYDIGRLVGTNMGGRDVDYQQIELSHLNIGQMEKLYKIIGTYLLRNHLNRDLPSSFLHNFTDKFERMEVEAPATNDIVEFDRARLKMTEGKEKSAFMTSAAQLPYYQGIVLYFLGVTFPFFALIFLIPGRHSGFFMWFGFYFWAKSWDIGFAMAMMLDDVLFAIFEVSHQVETISHGLDEETLAKGLELPESAALAAHMASELDPTFQLATYYAIMGTVLHAIPVISAQIILGGMKGGSGLIAQGMKSYSDHFSQGSYGLSSARWVVANTTQANQHMAQAITSMTKGYGQHGSGSRATEKGTDKANSGIKYQTLNALHNDIQNPERISRMMMYGGAIGFGSGREVYTGDGFSAKNLGQSGALAQEVSELFEGGTTKNAVASGMGRLLTQAGNDAQTYGDMNMKTYISNLEAAVTDAKHSSIANSLNNLGMNIEVGYHANSDGQDHLFDQSNREVEMLFSAMAGGAEVLLNVASSSLISEEQQRYQNDSSLTGGVKSMVTGKVAAFAAGALASRFLPGSDERKNQGFYGASLDRFLKAKADGKQMKFIFKDQRWVEVDAAETEDDEGFGVNPNSPNGPNDPNNNKP